MQIGLSGMRAASTVVAARARNIANVSTKGYLPVEPIERSTDGGVQVALSQPAMTPEAEQALAEMPPVSVDLADELMQMRLAEIAYKASAKVVKAASQMADATVSITT